MHQIEKHKSHLWRFLMTWENIFKIILRKRLIYKTMVCAQGEKLEGITRKC